MKSQREIRFRGKTLESFVQEDGSAERPIWVYGSLSISTRGIQRGYWIGMLDLYSPSDWTQVDPETIGQEVKRIYEDSPADDWYEGDILLVAESERVRIIWDDQTKSFDTSPQIFYGDWGWREAIVDHADRMQKIGNIHDNPEMMLP